MGGRTDTSPRVTVVYFSSNKLPKTDAVTTFVLFGHVTLLWGHFSLFSLVKDMCSYQTVRPTCHHAAGLSIHIAMACQCCASDTTPRDVSAPERNFTPCLSQDPCIETAV